LKFNVLILRRKIKIIRGEKFMADKKYIVAARVETDNKDCIVVEEGAMIMATHRVVYGPDTKEKCEQWKSRNCK